MGDKWKIAFDTRCQSFYNEALGKENLLRMKWFLKNHQRLLDNLGQQQHTDKITPLEDTPEEHKSKQSTRLVCRKPLPNWRPLDPDGSIDIKIMKPVDPAVNAILYRKGVGSFITADNYKRERLKDHPENRYYFPDCTSWVYGWRLKDYPPIFPSKVGMKSVMQTEFYHPKASSIHRDPEWYRESQTRNVKNCCDPTDSQ